MQDTLSWDHIFEHARQPKNKGVLTDATVHTLVRNPMCGDELTLFLDTKNKMIVGVMFENVGCAISTASASLVTEYLKGKSLTEAKLMTPGDVYTLLTFEITPSRTDCALLVYKALQESLKKLY